MLNRILSALTWPVRKIAGLERQGRVVWSLALVDAGGLAMWLFALNGYFFHRPLDQDDYSTIICVPPLCYAAFLQYGLQPGQPWWRWIAGTICGEGLAAAILHLAFVKLGMNLSGAQVLKLFAYHLPLLLLTRLVYLICRRTLPRAPLECVRLALVLGAGFFFLGGRFATSAGVGSGDSYWYCIMVADFVKQWRAGVFPAFVGQSLYAFNGAVSPLRLAPGLQHIAGFIDLITGRSLPFFTLLNMTLFLSALGGIFSAYFCAVAILPRQRWTALALSILFLACPGVLSIGYQGDLFMSMTALPFVPLVCYGTWRTMQGSERVSVAWTVLPLAAAWLCHPPIALWLTFVAALGHLAVGIRRWRDPLLYRWWAQGVALFVLTAGYLFVSVATLHLPKTGSDVDVILESVRAAFPGMLLPVSETAGTLGDYQLGWALWGMLLLAAAYWAFRPRREEGVLLLGAGFILLLLMPIPGLNRALWHALPVTVRDITFHWPMQRLYAVLAGAVLVAAAGTWARLAPDRVLWRVTGALFLSACLGWSFREGITFVFHDYFLRGPAPTPLPEPMLKENNIVLTRYSFNPFPFVPPYYTHGYVDPYLENRVLTPDMGGVLEANAVAVRPPDTATRIPMTAGRDSLQVAYMTPHLSLAPNVRYAVRFAPSSPPGKGSLLVTGKVVVRMYYMPDSAAGMNRLVPGDTFGLTKGSRDFFPIWTTEPGPETITFEYHFDAPPEAPFPTAFARVYLQTYNVENLPVRVLSWIPYRAKTAAPASGAWLETPRMFVAGYAATVNGRAAKVSRSPSGLVAIRLESGANDVVLRYPGPWPLRAAYWTALFTWVAVVVLLVRHAVRRWPTAASA